MRIVHVCINNPFVEGMGYQENMISNYQVQDGNEVFVISINLIYNDKYWKHVPTGITKYEGVNVIRLSHHRLTWGLIFPHGLYKSLKNIQPHVIMHHNVNCTSLVICEWYCMFNKNCKLIADNHADYINCNQNKKIQWGLYKILIGGSQKILGRYTKFYYGVSYMRCDFLKDMFKLPSKKIKFLPIGTDVTFANTIADKHVLKEKYNVSKSASIIVSGGKMGKQKGTDVLILAIEEMRKQGGNYELYLFGKFEDKETQELIQSKEFVHFTGWCNRQKTLELLKLSDIAIWAIHHTTLAEDAVSVETPLILRKTRTTEHLIDGNGIFIQKGTKEEIMEAISTMMKSINDNTTKEACKRLKNSLNYRNISSSILTDIA